MDQDRLNVFRTVAAEASFSKAARKLRRTQPAVSLAIKTLEEELGESLFQRRGASTQLTHAGQILLEHVDQAFHALECGRVRISALKQLNEGHLTIATYDALVCYFLPRVLGAFHRRYPGVQIQTIVRPCPIALAEIVAREADIGVLYHPVSESGLVSEPLTQVESVVICSPSHPLAGKKSAAIEDLLEYPILMLERPSPMRQSIEERLSQRKKVSAFAMAVDNFEAIKKLVQADLGISILPEIAVREEVRRRELVSIPLNQEARFGTVGLVYRAHSPLSLAAQAFIEVLKEVVAAEE